MKLAVIDIGSNAIRLQVSSATRGAGQVSFKKIEYIRFPLRLGKDVFNIGEISPPVAKKFKKLMHTFMLLIELYEVDDYMACATSAMREAANGHQLARQVRKETGLQINIIDGDQEALLINNAINPFLEGDDTYVHIDVGGGSTEINIYANGEKLAARSFKIGSVRRLNQQGSTTTWDLMQEWVSSKTHGLKGRVSAIGTGGNINKIYELNKHQGNGVKDPRKLLTLSQAKSIQKLIQSYSIEERIDQLKLNPDRADVILPASEIYISIMEWAGAFDIAVPGVGLKDGIIGYLYKKNNQ